VPVRFLVALYVALDCLVRDDCASNTVTDILSECTTPASAVAAQDDMCHVQVPPLFKDVNIIVNAVHIRHLTLEYYYCM